MLKVVFDTNVIVAAMCSADGASHKLLLNADQGQFRLVLSIPLVTEYEDVVFRPIIPISISVQDREAILNWICKIGINQKIHYLWRPFLRDPKDDMVLETALAGGAEYIVTFNVRDFEGTENLGIKTIRPSELLEIL